MSPDQHCKPRTMPRAMISNSELEMLIHVSSRIDYCNTLFMRFNEKAINYLQTVQIAAARLLTRAKKRDHISPVLYSVHWLPVNLDSF